GRAFDAVPSFKTDRQVGIFFWPWLGQPYYSGLYDATKIAALPNGINILTNFDYLDPTISPEGQLHYWGEPIWGYYNSEDEWVIRKQMAMLTMAGVDFIYFDMTNHLIYENILKKVCEVISDMMSKGWDAPQIACYTHARSMETVWKLYNEFYKLNLYPETWYRIDGKPLIIAYTDKADDLAEAASTGDTTYNPAPYSSEILSFFHFFKPQWPYDDVFDDGFPWVEWIFPQPYHSETGVMNVTVAAHPGCPMSFSLTRPGWINWGRGWDPDTQQNISENVDKGTFFQRQWDRVLEFDPPMISVGGWNEWVSGKHRWDGEFMLCDCASKEYSRDIEPMEGGYQDAFYLQLIRNIHKYKGTAEAIRRNPKTTIDISGSVSQWDDVEYVQTSLDVKYMDRDAYSGSQIVRYRQTAPLDKIMELKVAHDDANVYFYIKCKEKLSSFKNRDNWLNIFIGTGEPESKVWESYEYVIGRDPAEETLSVAALNGDFSSREVGQASISRFANMIQVSVPRSLMKLDKESSFYFKVAMGVSDMSDIMNSYRTGSAMPMGRLSYMYYFDK
ncbi:MAG: hypothetical protein HUJ91_00810, partial [Bacteroidales bacterium]|nr:hypothetical protein [Bacteroidales bacterium]